MKYLFRLTMAIAIISVLIWIGDGLAAHWEAITQISVYALILSVLTITVGRTVMAYKWLRLLRCRGEGMPLRKATQIYCASNMWGLFLPATVGADTLRTVCACREGLNGHNVVASILLERGIGFIILSFLCLMSVLYFAGIAPLNTTLYYSGWAAAVLFAGLTVGLWLSFTQSIYNFIHDVVLERVADKKPVQLLRRLHNAYLEYTHHRRELVAFAALTCTEAAVTAAAFWIIARGMGIEIGLGTILAAVFLSELASRIPLSVGGLGVFEAIFVLMLSLVGISTTEALSVALLGRMLKILSWLPWWLSYTMEAGSFSAPSKAAAPIGDFPEEIPASYDTESTPQTHTPLNSPAGRLTPVVRNSSALRYSQNTD